MEDNIPTLKELLRLFMTLILKWLFKP